MGKKPKHRMYKLYIVIDVINAIGLIVPIICGCVSIGIISEAVSWSYISFKDLITLLMLIGVAIFSAIYFISRLGNHYSRIDKVRKVNPGLVSQYEEEFVLAKDLGNEIFLSEHFLFISGAKKFVVATPDEVKSVRVFMRRTRHGRWIKYEIKGDDFSETVQICGLSNDEDRETINKSIAKLSSWIHVPITVDDEVKRSISRD